MTAYIITRNRLGNIKKVVPRWLSQNIPVRLLVEGSEYDAHKSLVREMSWDNVEVIKPPNDDYGIGYCRRWAVRHADSSGLKSIIMSDDDVRPTTFPTMHMLLREAEKPDILGIGATRTLHDRFTDGAVSQLDGLILCPGGWGMQLFALNVDNTRAIGNFDHRLDCWGEDHELMRKGIAAGIPWLVHCGVRCEAIGARYEPGGLNAFIGDGDRTEREQRCREIIYKRWPRYVSPPNKKPRMQWIKMMDEYLPHWRTRSELHGGEW